MSKGMVTVCSPKGELPERGKPIDRGWKGELRGKTIGFLDNGRTNADLLLRLISERLVQTLDVKPLFLNKKDYWVAGMGPTSGTLSGKEVLSFFEGKVDAVIAGLGN